jgi:uncharacterized delta-60 repeat protein
VAALLALAAPPAFAADGDLDTDFHFDGFNTRDCGLFEERGEDMALQPDGKAVLVSRSADGEACLTRFTATGSIDMTFDGDGSVALTAGEHVRAGAVAVQPDGRILVAGAVDTGEGVDTIVFRRNPDGGADTTFDGDGQAINGFSATTSDAVNDLAVQPDGRIVVAGTATDPSFPGAMPDVGALRLDATGALDASFSGDGRTVESIVGSGPDTADAVVLQGSRIVLAGTAGDDFAGGFAALGLTASGERDPAFGPSGNGQVVVGLGSGARAFDVVLAPDGGLVLAGRVAVSSPIYSAGVVKLDPAGRLDRGFSGDGAEVFEFGPEPSSGAVAVANTIDGKYAVAGSLGSRLATAKLTPTGALDPSFGPAGKRVYDGVPIAGRAMSAQVDGKLVVGGSADPSGGGVARILDSLPVVAASGASAREGGTLPFFVGLNKTSGFPVSVDYATGTGIAAAPADFLHRSGTLTIPPGNVVGVVPVVTILDRLFEPNETLRLEIFNPVNANVGESVAPGSIQNRLRSGACANVVLGRAGIDIITGSTGGDRIRGRPGDDVLFGLAGADCLSGERGHDQLDGGAGNDRLDGGTGNDRIKGDSGNDRIVGGRGINRYSGGSGNDKIYARNGRAEIVECGPGRDFAKVDRRDRTRRCERVQRSRG